jgi:hypothetical protein
MVKTPAHLFRAGPFIDGETFGRRGPSQPPIPPAGRRHAANDAYPRNAIDAHKVKHGALSGAARRRDGGASFFYRAPSRVRRRSPGVSLILANRSRLSPLSSRTMATVQPFQARPCRFTAAISSTAQGASKRSKSSTRRAPRRRLRAASNSSLNVRDRPAIALRYGTRE